MVLHGLFGMLDNWQTIGRKLSDDYMVYLIDQRNHGKSPHLPSISYPLMADDLNEFAEKNWIHHSFVLGHSMGGKTAMQYALAHPDQVEKLIVIDIAPKAYTGNHFQIFEALFAVDLNLIKDRREAEGVLAKYIDEPGVRQFLLKNLSRQKTGGFRWKMNLEAIHQDYSNILAGLECVHPYEGETLFIRGGRSNYVSESDFSDIQKCFPHSQLITIPDSGHWVHAEAPDALLKEIKAFLE